MSQNHEERVAETGGDSVNVNVTTDQEASDVPNPQGDGQAEAGSSAGYKYGIFKRQIKYDPLSIVFAILVFIGGLIGFIAKQSTPSLVAGTIFALLIGIFTFVDGARRSAYSSLPLIVTLLALGITMLVRYYKNMNFMPSGLVALLAFLMVGRHCYLLYLRKFSRPV